MSAAGGLGCAEAELLIAARAGGGLSTPEADALTQHLATCDGCRAVGVSLVPAGDDGDDRDDHGVDGALAIVEPSAYQLGAELARGGMGRILLAHDQRIGREVAIKELTARTPASAARFEREARLTARLQHPGIVPIYEIGAWPDGTPFYAMRLVRGGTLGDAIARAVTPAARRALLPSMITACDAVGFAHDRGVIHRDLTPANILRGDHGETVVIDWGLAKELGTDDGAAVEVGPYRQAAIDPARTAAGAVFGTVAYMAPEQARGEAVDARADVYALGAILHHVLTGHAPFAGAPDDVLAAVRAGARPRGVIDGPRDLISVVEKAMAPAAADRYADAGALAAELRRFHDGLLVAAHAYTAGERLARWGWRYRVALVVAIAALVVLAVVGGLAIQRVVRARDRANRSDQQVKVLLAQELFERGRTALLAGRRDDGARLLLRARELAPFDPWGQYVLARAFDGRTPTFAAAVEPHERATVRIRPGTTDAVVAFTGGSGWAQLALERADVRTGSHAAMAVPWPRPIGESAWLFEDPNIEYSTDGELVLVAHGHHVGVWGAADGELRTWWQVDGAASATFVPGTRDVLAWDDGRWWRRDAASGRVLADGDGLPADAQPGGVLADGRVVVAFRGEDDVDPRSLAVYQPGADRPDATIPADRFGGGWAVVDAGRRIVTCAGDGEIAVWAPADDTRGLIERTKIRTGVRGLHGCAPSADGQRVVAIAGEPTATGRARLVGWSLLDGAPLFAIDGADDAYDAVRLVGAARVAASSERTTAIYDAAHGRLEGIYLGTLDAGAGSSDVDDHWAGLVDGYQFEEHPKPGATQRSPRVSIGFLDLDRAGPIRRYATAAHGIARVIAAADGGRTGLGVDGDGRLAIWEAARDPRVLPDLAAPAAMTRGGTRIAAWSRRGAVMIVDARGQVLREVRQGATAPVAIALSAEGHQVLVVQADGTAAVIDVASGQARAVPGDGVVGGALDDHGHVLVCYRDRGSRVHDLNARRDAAAGSSSSPCTDGLGSFGRSLVAIDRRNHRVVAADHEGAPRLLFGSGEAVAVDSHGVFVVTASGRRVHKANAAAYVTPGGFRSSNYPAIARWPRNDRPFVVSEAAQVQRVAVSLESLLIATDDGIYTFDGVLLTSFARAFASPPAMMSFAPDGRSLAVIDRAGEVTIWDTSRDERAADALRPLLGPTGPEIFRWPETQSMGGH